MNEKEIAELRRRYRAEKNNIHRVCGCFVNEKKEIISEFDQSLGMSSEEEADQILGVMKKVLSGALGRNLLEVEFSTAQVMESEGHRLLSQLRGTQLKEGETVRALYEKIAASLTLESSYVILLTHDNYDVFSYTADGERDESSQVFSYILCSICPLKEGKPNLSYYLPGKCFRSVGADMVIAPPVLGFTFPAFEEGSANIYKALYYTKDLTNSHEELASAIFENEIPMPAAEQQQTFGGLLEQTMAEDCSLRVVRSVQSQVRQLVEEHKEEKREEPLTLGKEEAGDMLRYCGVPEERVTLFEEKYEEAFGKDAELPPVNLVAGKSMKVKTPEVSIQVSPGCGDLVETRVIDGVRYILVRAEGDVTVNGVNVHI